MSDQTAIDRERLRDMAIRWRENLCSHAGRPDPALDPYCCHDCVKDAEKNVLPLLLEVAALAEAERERLRGALQFNQPWPVADVLTKLAAAADHLLSVHDCDTHGWEGVGIAATEARKIVKALAGSPEGTEAAENDTRTVASIAAMLGWMNVPPRETLEADIRALKARAQPRADEGTQD